MESNEKIRQQFFKMNFLKKLWYSISKFERYPEMASLGVKKAILYFTELILIVSVIFTAIYVYYIKNVAEFDEELNFSEKTASILTSKVNKKKIKNIETITESLKNKKSEILIFYMGSAFFTTLIFDTMLNVFTLSIFGILTCIFARIKMNYKALFNMSIYAFTLSILLRTIYFAITKLTTFEIKYFEIMYIAIAYISLAAAIFIIKSNVIKQHIELMRIIEESKDKIEETFSIPKKPKDEDKEDNDEKKDEDKNNNERDKSTTEGQGSNA